MLNLRTHCAHVGLKSDIRAELCERFVPFSDSNYATQEITDDESVT